MFLLTQTQIYTDDFTSTEQSGSLASSRFILLLQMLKCNCSGFLTRQLFTQQSCSLSWGLWCLCLSSCKASRLNFDKLFPWFINFLIFPQRSKRSEVVVLFWAPRYHQPSTPVLHSGRKHLNTCAVSKLTKGKTLIRTSRFWRIFSFFSNQISTERDPPESFRRTAAS